MTGNRVSSAPVPPGEDDDDEHKPLRIPVRSGPPPLPVRRHGSAPPPPQRPRSLAPPVASLATGSLPPPPIPNFVISEAQKSASLPPAADPAADFVSSGSEMPVVRSTAAPPARLTLRSVPRALLVTAPLVALFVVWQVHHLASRHASAAHAANRTTLAAPSAPGPALTISHAISSAAPPAPPSAAPTPSPLPPAIADDAQLRSAVTKGLPALETLAEKFPGDPQVLIALANGQARAQRYEAAVATVERALDAAPSSAQSGKIMGILWRSTQSAAAEPSFLCLRKLGARGSDIAFDLATTAGVREAVRERATQELTSFLASDASPDTRAATALLLAPDCSTRKSLLERAEQDGKKRTLGMLERFARGAGCSSSSEGACNSCLMGSPILARARSKLNAEVKP